MSLNDALGLLWQEFEYQVAGEKEILSIPLSDNVFGLMQECNCVISMSVLSKKRN